jgi:uncharacterized protein (TIGR02271 family)
MFDQPKIADAATRALAKKGFHKESIDILTLDDKSDAPKIALLNKTVPQPDLDVYLAALAKGGALVVVSDLSEKNIDDAIVILNAAGAVDVDDRLAELKGVDSKLELAPAIDEHDQEEEADVIQLAQEDAAVNKRMVERRRLRAYTVVKERQAEATVALRDETVQVSRRKVNRAVDLNDDLFKTLSIEMAEVDEEAKVVKSARIVEEVELTKEYVENLATLRETLRYTDVAVEEQKTGTVVGEVNTNVAMHDVKK